MKKKNKGRLAAAASLVFIQMSPAKAESTSKPVHELEIGKTYIIAVEQPDYRYEWHQSDAPKNKNSDVKPLVMDFNDESEFQYFKNVCRNPDAHVGFRGMPCDFFRKGKLRYKGTINGKEQYEFVVTLQNASDVDSILGQTYIADTEAFADGRRSGRIFVHFVLKL